MPLIWPYINWDHKIFPVLSSNRISVPSTPPTAKYLLLLEICISFVSNSGNSVTFMFFDWLIQRGCPVCVAKTPKGHLVFLLHPDVTKAAYFPSEDKSAFHPSQGRSYVHTNSPFNVNKKSLDSDSGILFQFSIPFINKTKFSSSSTSPVQKPISVFMLFKTWKDPLFKGSFITSW